jgi:hypothetical protein
VACTHLCTGQVNNSKRKFDDFFQALNVRSHRRAALFFIVRLNIFPVELEDVGLGLLHVAATSCAGSAAQRQRREAGTQIRAEKRAARRAAALLAGEKEKSPQISLRAFSYELWCGWQELNPRPLGS